MKTAACTPGAGCQVPEGAITDLILKELWLFISICLVAPGRTGTQGLALVSPSSEHSQVWGGFPNGICQKHLKAKVLARAAWGKGQQSGQARDRSKSLVRKNLGKEIYRGVRVFKSSCLSQGIEKAMHMPKTGHMFRKGLILRKDPKLSPLANLQALHKQEVKVRAVL